VEFLLELGVSLARPRDGQRGSTTGRYRQHTGHHQGAAQCDSQM
jgi:hypothetical protein